MNRPDLFTIFANDHHMILYRPEWNRFTGSATASILLGQILYRWDKNNRQPFYKYKQPCPDNSAYRPGDSWTEELGFSRYEFDAALKQIAVKRSKKQTADHQKPVEYWTDISRKTFYTIHEANLTELLVNLYTSEPENAPIAIKSESSFTKSDDPTLRKESNPLYVKSESSFSYKDSKTTSKKRVVIPRDPFFDEVGLQHNLTYAFLEDVMERHQVESVEELRAAVEYVHTSPTVTSSSALRALLMSGEVFHSGKSKYRGAERRSSAQTTTSGGDDHPYTGTAIEHHASTAMLADPGVKHALLQEIHQTAQAQGVHLTPEQAEHKLLGLLGGIGS